MNRRRHAVRAGIVLGTLSALVYGGCASSGSSSAPKMSAAEIVSERQRLMKLNGASWSDAQAKFKAGNIEGIAVNAETMAMNAREIPKLFPEGSMTADSKAKPEIWKEQAKFKELSDKLQAETEKLLVAAKGGNLDAIKAQVAATGDTCKSCHDAFRNK